MAEQPLYELYKARLEALRDRPLNFDIEQRASFTAANGWHVDDVQVELPPEPPGPPVPDGSWEAARRIMREYRFADPSIITGIFVPDTPLEQRVMLLRGSAYGLTFWLGTRVGEVIDERRQADDGERQVWGFSYRTLEGHVERGEMVFTVIKALTTGKVAFRINAVSRAADIRNPIIRLGFRLFGRRLQLRFVQNSLERMRRLVADELGLERAREAREPGPPVVRSAGATSQSTEHVGALLDQQEKQDKGVTVSATKLARDLPVEGEDITRVLVFTSFWGTLYYLLACVSLIAGARRQPVEVDARTVATGYGVHLLAFMAGGALTSAAGALVRGKRPTEQAEEAIGGGQLERSWPLQAAGGAAGAVLPLGLAVASQAISGQLTRRPSLAEDVTWPVVGATMVTLSGLVALAVARITAWVAEDAKSGVRR